VKSVNRLTVGLFGLVYHLAVAALLATKAARSTQGDPGAVVAPTVAVALAAFVVYALVVTPYARKRYGTAKKGVVFFDFLVGMVVEVAVVAVAALMYALYAAAPAFAAQGVTAYLSGVLRGTALAFLWAIGPAMTEVLAVGNGAGVLGYVLLKKLAGRGDRGAAAAAPR